MSVSACEIRCGIGVAAVPDRGHTSCIAPIHHLGRKQIYDTTDPLTLKSSHLPQHSTRRRRLEL
ncbi:hypothetical protein E2C01_097736 [Portunus trituberculatus]|uniref:Uncharacterized protein n=1 Tax=Portunus trituberculatus TaxID=210409 RepID=A0A5B7KC63_PORTR|nr:hypothetical protein [Portunus trituberculatus]